MGGNAAIKFYRAAKLLGYILAYRAAQRLSGTAILH